MLAWRRESPEHEREYRELQRLAILAARINELGDAGAPPAMAELIAAADGETAPTKPPRSREPTSRHLKPWWWPAAAAMVAVVVLGLGLARWVAPGGPLLGVQQFVADQSGAMTTTLRDSSVVRLAPGSRLRLAASSDRVSSSASARAT